MKKYVSVIPWNRLSLYAYLMRLDKPIGIFLLLWPTLWALWLASLGHPDDKILFIFIAGVILMRSAGCILNDFADRHIDAYVKRTQNRPLASGKLTSREALILAGLLSLLAFLLVLNCNFLTIYLACVSASIALIYPFLKRITHLPQLGLSVAFSWGIPMAFAAVTNSLNSDVWFLFFTSALWPIIYDTMYAMVDREDDLKIGVKSTAVLFNAMDKMLIALLQLLFMIMLIVTGIIFHLSPVFYLSIVVVTLLFGYQQWLIKDRDPQKCFHAFLNNNWVGLVIFVGIFLSFPQ